MSRVPTIKGAFIASHMHKLRSVKGASAILKLEKSLGHEPLYDNFGGYPITEELAVPDHVLLALHPKTPASQLHLESDRMHFRNFAETPMGKIVRWKNT